MWPITTFGRSSSTKYRQSRADATGIPADKHQAVEYLAIGRLGVVGAARIDPTPPNIVSGWLHFRRQVAINYSANKASDKLRPPPWLAPPAPRASIPVWGPAYIHKVAFAFLRASSTQRVAAAWEVRLQEVTQKFIVSTQAQVASHRLQSSNCLQTKHRDETVHVHKGKSPTNDPGSEGDEHEGGDDSGSGSLSEIDDEEEGDGPPPRPFLKTPPVPRTGASGLPPTRNRASGDQNLAEAIPASQFASSRQELAGPAAPTDSTAYPAPLLTPHRRLPLPLEVKSSTDQSALLRGGQKLDSLDSNHGEEKAGVCTPTRNGPSNYTASGQDVALGNPHLTSASRRRTEVTDPQLAQCTLFRAHIGSATYLRSQLRG